MTSVNMFNNVSLDGYFTDANNDMSWAHAGARRSGNARVHQQAMPKAAARWCSAASPMR